MEISRYIKNRNEKPLDNIAMNGGMCRIFRRIACVGDSLSSGEFQIKKEDGTFDYYDNFEYSWGQHIARMTGSTVLNFSRGGMTAKEYLESFADMNGFWKPENACQAYIIALGANDLTWCEQEVGVVEDIDINDYHNNKETFAGYYGAVVQKYKKIQPRAKFFFVTLPNHAQYLKNKEHRDILEKLTGIFENSYLIDLYTYAPKYDDVLTENFFMHGHMNPNGYVFTADMIASYIDYIVRNYPSDFEEVGFIGTNITDYKGVEESL